MSAGLGEAPVAAPPRRMIGRIAAGLIAAVVALNLLLGAIGAATREPSGPRSSAYATAPEGLAAYADLVGRAGHPVARLRRAPDDGDLDPRTTLVILDPDVLLPAEARALRRFVAMGGDLVLGTRRPGRWLAEILPGPPRWSAAGLSVARTVAPAPETSGVQTVRTGAEGSWSAPGTSLPVLGGRARALMTVHALGRGRLALLADPSALQNRFLAQADNAALGLALAGPPGRPVEFLETVHGYGEQRGLAALPGRWRLALGGLILAALVWLAASARRLGPPEEETRALAPPRRSYVDAIAASLARTRQPEEAVAPVRAAARAQVLRRAGLSAGAGDDAVREAAVRLGVSSEDARALTTATDGEDVMTAGRALAELTRERR